MQVFIAGAANTGFVKSQALIDDFLLVHYILLKFLKLSTDKLPQVEAPNLRVDDKRLSAMPLANLAKVLAEQGATRARSAHFLSSI